MPPTRNWRIAIVVQRYGEEVNGGAEDAARWLAEKLATLAEVHAITTCALDYTTWADHYPAGESNLNGVKVHRFPVDQARHWQQAQKRTGRFMLSRRSIEEEIDWIRQEGPFSTPLLQFIKRSEPDFDLFIFFTYLYATTFFGLPLVAHKAILVPAAHDDAFLYMDAYRALFHLPRCLVYLTQAEREMATRVTGNGRIPSQVIAVGIQAPPAASAERFRQKYGIEGDFLLYGGRISQAKNVPELLDYFQRYRLGHPGRRLKLVLMGKPDMDLPGHADVMPIGFVPEQDKFDGLKAATMVVLPSLLESLSIVILQAWLMETPVLVDGRCQVTRQQCRQSNGGLYYTSYDEFEAALTRLLDSADLRAKLGQQGRAFTRQNYEWGVVLARYQQLLQTLIG